MAAQHTISVVGNPNCGKTTLFNALTGSRQRVGNWPGVTVDKKTGEFKLEGNTVELVDLPGIYSLIPGHTSSEDERIARDYILSNASDVVINIVDAANLERNLFLTTQVADMGVPMVVVLNMVDIARQHGLNIDMKALSERLNCPVVAVTASTGEGIEALRQMLTAFLKAPSMTKTLATKHDPRVAKAAAEVEEILRADGIDRPQWTAMEVIENAPGVAERLDGRTDLNRLGKIVGELNAACDDQVDVLIASARYDLAHDVAQTALKGEGHKVTLTERIDRIVLDRWLGVPIFLGVMYVMFLFTQNVGAAFIDFFDILVGGVLVDGLSEGLSAIGTPDWIRVFLANGIGAGLQTVSTFIPVIFFLYLFLAVLEDSGYMARAAFVVDRMMRAIGLPGKAFVPLIVGFGCNVPAIMAARTMDRASDRIITVLMAPFMSCGARLPVYVLFATAFFPTNGQNLVFGLYIIGILAAILTGFLLKASALPGAAAPFVMEIPPYHIPTVRGVLTRTWERVSTFTLRAGKTIVVIVAALSILNSLGTDGSFGNEDSEQSVLSMMGRSISPALEPMGVERENWPAAVGIFTGIFAKEAVVGTLNSLYASVAAQQEAAAAGDEPVAEEEAEEPWSFSAVLSEAVGTTVDNLTDLGSAILDPMGITVGDLSDEGAAAEEQGVTTTMIDTIRTLFGTSTAAFAYLLMILLYMPCVAAVAALVREAGMKWAVFGCAWTTVLGYSAAVIFYRTVHFADDPAYACTAIGICAVLLVGMFFWMKAAARRDADREGPRRKVIPIMSVR